MMEEEEERWVEEMCTCARRGRAICRLWATLDFLDSKRSAFALGKRTDLHFYAREVAIRRLPT